MSEQDTTEDVASQTDTTEEVVKTEEVEVETAQDDTEDLEALQEKNKKLFERAKKAEAEAKLLKAERLKAEEQAKVKPAPEKTGDLTAMDTIALIENKVTVEEDIELVREYARFKNIPVSEALKSSVVRGEIADRVEKRKTAEAANTGPSKRVSTKVSDESILSAADKGQWPEDPEAFAQARLRAMKSK